ncbi:hypothetical protein RhiirB3_480069 [Rhizophagus irregularis]|nr:hypothetical protein RhiirB3_480069 [Rhizophagus irregularis]
MPFYDDDDDRPFYKNKLLISAERRSAFEEKTSYRDRNNNYSTTKTSYESEIKFKSSIPLYTPSESNRVTPYKNYTPKISDSGCVTTYKNNTPFKGSAEIINSERTSIRNYRSNGSASLDHMLHNNYESKFSAEIANKDDNDFKIEARARRMYDSDINGVKTKFDVGGSGLFDIKNNNYKLEANMGGMVDSDNIKANFDADCSGLFDIKNNNYKLKAKARGMAELDTDDLKAKIEADGSASWDNVSNDFNIEGRMKGMVKSDFDDGSTAKVEVDCSGSCGNNERKIGASIKSSIQKDELTFLQSKGSVKSDDLKISSKLSSTVFRAKDEDLDFKFLNATVENKFGINKDGVDCMEKLGVSLVEFEGAGIKSKIGLNLDTGMSVNSNTMEIKVEGFGIKLGKETGFSTPIGEVSVDLGRYLD